MCGVQIIMLCDTSFFNELNENDVQKGGEKKGLLLIKSIVFSVFLPATQTQWLS